MADLSEIVKRDYDAEIKIIEETGGNLWPKWIGMTMGIGAIWAFERFLGEPWSKRQICLGIVFIIAAPLVARAWDRYDVAVKMRHHREIRIEAKLDLLLGFREHQRD